MDVTIATIYCLCDDFLKAMNHRPGDLLGYQGIE